MFPKEQFIRMGQIICESITKDIDALIKNISLNKWTEMLIF